MTIPLQPRAASGAVLTTANFSKTWTFFDGDWHEGNVAIMGARTHAAWLGSMVFDGARAFEGVTPDLELHCARVNTSAANFPSSRSSRSTNGSASPPTASSAFDRNAELYIRPMYWAETGAAGGVRHDPEFDALVPVHLRGAAAEADRQRHHAVAVPPARPPNARRSTPRPAASIRTMRAPSSRRARAASTIA